MRPPLTRIGPVQVLTPAKVSVPAPDLVTPRLPLTEPTLRNVPDCRSSATLRFVLFAKVEVNWPMALPAMSNVPPDTVRPRKPPPPPCVTLPLMVATPPLTVMRPVWGPLFEEPKLTPPRPTLNTPPPTVIALSKAEPEVRPAIVML